MIKNIPRKPEWWPVNPYPEDIFPATIEDYKKVIPDENTRMAISGYLGRRFWNLASDEIWEAMQNEVVDEPPDHEEKEG